MNRGIRFSAALWAGWVLLAPVALGDGAAGSLPPATAAPKPAAPKLGSLKPGPLNPGPLNPGKSAGVRAAQQTQTGLALVGAGAIIAVIAVTAGSSGGGNAQPNSQSVATTS